MTTIETTFQDAVERCTKNGGRFCYSKGNYWTVNKEGEIVAEVGNAPFTLFSQHFGQKWNYEPPQKSAFQEWLETSSSSHFGRTENCLRKEGWNGFADHMVKWCDGWFPESLREIIINKIQNLKEP